MEYEFCSNKKLVKYQDCKASCEEMNTDSESGWTLAVIPSEYHNNKVNKFIAISFGRNTCYVGLLIFGYF